MSDLIHRPNGEISLRAGADPSHGERAIGFERYWLGVDLGQAEDPTALTVIKDQRLPAWDGARQTLLERERTVVFADRVTGRSYADILNHITAVMVKPPLLGKVQLAIDATGLGRVISDMLDDVKVKHFALQTTVGQNWRRDGKYVNVGKHLLLENLSVLFAKELKLASGLPLYEDLIAEFETFELGMTNAGNPIIMQGARGSHHGDLAIALAVAAFASQYLVPGVAKMVPVNGMF